MITLTRQRFRAHWNHGDVHSFSTYYDFNSHETDITQSSIAVLNDMRNADFPDDDASEECKKQRKIKPVMLWQLISILLFC